MSLGYVGRNLSLKNLNGDPEAKILSTEGRFIGPCWEKLRPKRPKVQCVTETEILVEQQHTC